MSQRHVNRCIRKQATLSSCIFYKRGIVYQYLCINIYFIDNTLMTVERRRRLIDYKP